VDLIKCEGALNSIAFSPDGYTLATADLYAILALWQFDSRKQESNLPAGDIPRVVRFDRSGRYLVVGTSIYPTVQVWDYQKRKRLRLYKGHEQEVNTLAVHPTFGTIASGSTDGLLFLWGIDSTKKELLHNADGDFIDALDFSPDGKLLAAAITPDLYLWSQHKGKWHLERKVRVGQWGINAIAFSPDGQLFAIATRKETEVISLFDTRQWRPLRTLRGHTGGINDVTFSPDGKRLVSVSDDKTVRLWATDSEKELRIFTGHKRPCVTVAYHPHKDVIASGATDETVRFWTP